MQSTRCPVRKVLRQRPSLAWSSNSSTTCIASLEDAPSRSSPGGDASMTPAAENPSRCDASLRQPVKQLDDIKVIDEVVSDFDQRVDYILGLLIYRRYLPVSVPRVDARKE